MGVRSVLWTLYDLHRLGLVLRSVKPVGVLPVQLAGRDVALKESAYCVASDAVVDGAVIRGVRYVKWKNRIDGGPDRKIQGTIQSRIMRLLSKGGPRRIKEIIERVKPKTLIPIHTIEPHLFEGLHQNVKMPTLEPF